MAAEKTKLEGVWQIVEVTTTGPNASTNRKPQPSLFIFTGNYYSRTSVTGNAPRTAPADMAKATAAELREVLRFAANAGTYETKGGDIIFHPSVALGVAVMAPGSKVVSSFKVVGNTLTLTPKSNQNGPVANPTTAKLRRIQ